MLRNYLKIAFRNLLKYRLYSFINIAGLAVGLAVSVIILLYVQDEWSFDKFHPNSDRLYRAWTQERMENEVFFNTQTPFVLGPTLKSDLPEVEAFGRFVFFQDLVKRGSLTENATVYLLDPSMFEMFEFPWSQGQAASFGQDLSQVVLSKERAAQYFGEEDPMGKTLSIRIGGEYREFLVAGILEDIPDNSSLQFDIAIPFENDKLLFGPRMLNSWYNVMVETYVMLGEDTDTSHIAAKVPAMMQKALGEDYEEGSYDVGLQPLTDIHLNPDFPAGIVQVSDWRYMYIMGGIALLILLIASINFMTLAVGRSISRAREVSIRKVVGASRIQLMMQFWSEALVIALVALVAGVFLADLSLPGFNHLAQKELSLTFSAGNVLAWLSLALALGLLSGSYPAIFLSSLSPHQAESSQKKGKGFILQGLVMMQFALSILLITSTLLMQEQLQFLQDKNLGYNQEHLVSVPYAANPSADQGLRALVEDGLKNTQLLKEKLATEPDILAMSSTTYSPGDLGWLNVGHMGEDKIYRRFSVNGVDYDYLTTMGVELKEGRFFSEENALDRNSSVVVNEAMVRAYAWEQPIGQYLPRPWEEHQIVGVVKDFHFTSLHQDIGPLAMAINAIPLVAKAPDVTLGTYPTPQLTLRLKGEGITQSLQTIAQAWEEVSPDLPFEYSFLDEQVGQQYLQEQRLGQILSISAGLAIFIACLGLFGIMAITVARRTKEIGVRKVMGASISDILLLMVRGFMGLVSLSMLLAFPLAWYLMQEWLTDFAYAITIGPASFLLAGGLSLAIALLTLSFQAWQAARSNPVDALRYE